LPRSARTSETLVDDSPQRGHGFRLSVEKILEKFYDVQWRRISVPLSLVAPFDYPIVWFVTVHNLKQARGIKKRSPLIVQNPEMIGLDPNHDIRQTWGQIRISHVLTP
jgi:hypothetical protein